MYTRKGLLAAGDAAVQHADHRHVLYFSSLDEATSRTANPRTSVTHFACAIFLQIIIRGPISDSIFL